MFNALYCFYFALISQAEIYKLECATTRLKMSIWQFLRQQFFFIFINLTFILSRIIIIIFLFYTHGFDLKSNCIDAQSFSNSFERVLGVVEKYRGSSNFVFYCIFTTQFFKLFWGGTLGAPSSLSLPPCPPPPVCIYE